MKRIIAILLSTIMLFSLSSCIYSQDDLNEEKQLSYDEGYEDGQASSYDEGYDDGYNDGYEEGRLDEYFSYQDTPENYGTSYEDGITPSSVFVTQTGEKYHKEDCQHLVGRNNLRYYNSASEAEADGYIPCDICY